MYTFKIVSRKYARRKGKKYRRFGPEHETNESAINKIQISQPL